jgi:hypothetical protein
MKFHHLVTGFVVLGLSASIALAAGKSDSVRSSRSAAKKAESVSVSSTSSGHTRMGVGFTTGNFGDSKTALSAWFDLNDAHSIQPMFFIGGTSPFTFGAGANYRYTLSGDQKNGFHLGGGLMLGIANKGGALASSLNAIAIAAGGGAADSTGFFININPMVGAHFTISGLERVMFSVEGGMSFQIIGGNFNYTVNSASDLLGLSIHYFL